MAASQATILERFRARTRYLGSCWLWEGPTDGGGYGCLRNDCGRMQGIHIQSFRYHCRELLPGEVVRHSCDKPSCWNPEHLSAGSHGDNVADKIARGRDEHGSDHYRSKLSTEQALEVYKLATDKSLTQTEIARRYGVTQSLVSAIKRGSVRKRSLT